MLNLIENLLQPLEPARKSNREHGHAIGQGHKVLHHLPLTIFVLEAEAMCVWEYGRQRLFRAEPNNSGPDITRPLRNLIEDKEG